MRLPFDLHLNTRPKASRSRSSIDVMALETRTRFARALRRRASITTGGRSTDMKSLALRVTELAGERGLHGSFYDPLMDAYWSEATMSASRRSYAVPPPRPGEHGTKSIA